MTTTGLRIVFVSEYFWPEIGGLERSTERLGAELVRLGHHVRMVTRHLPDTVAQECRRGIEVYRFADEPCQPFTATAAEDGLFAAPDVVCLFGVGHDPRARWWWPILDTPLGSHGVRLLKVGTDGDITRRGIPASTYQRLDGVLCQTDTIAEEARTVGVPAESCYPIRNGLPLSQWRAVLPARGDARTQLGCDEWDYVVLGLGRFAGRKRFGDLIAAFSAFTAALPSTTRSRPVLLLHGSDFGQSDGVEPALRDQIHQFGQAVDIRLIPPTVAPSETLAASDVMVTLSEREGAPNIFIEALASALPIIASDLPGHRVYVRSGREGLIVDVGDIGATAAALLALHADPALRRRMSHSAQVAASRFDIAETSHDYLRAFAHARSRTTARP